MYMKKINIFLSLIFVIMFALTGMLFLHGKTFDTVYADNNYGQKLELSSDSKFSGYSYIQNLTYYQSNYYNVREHYFLRAEYQDGFGTCWDFAGLKAIENFILVNFEEYYNFSETWIALSKKKSDSSYAYGDGGNCSDVNTQIRNKGVMLDCDMPYEVSYSIGTSSYSTYDMYYSQYATKNLITNFSFAFINIASYTYGSSADINAINYIKNYIWEYGAFCSAVDYDNVKTNTISGSYRNTPYIDIDNNVSNHAILIVGYDDNYVCNYNGQNVTGAWIAQNSHGQSNQIFYIPYKDLVWRSNINFISRITYNNYRFDFSKSSQENLQNYKQNNDTIYLHNSNTNYTAIGSIEIPKNVFRYSSSLTNQVVYKSSNLSFSNATVKIYKSKGNVTSLFNITKGSDTLTIKSKSGGLAYGTYKILITINGTQYLKNFVIFSGIDISYMLAWCQDIVPSEYIFLGFLIDETGKQNFTAYNDYVRFYFDNYSIVKSYKINNGSYSNISNYATSSRYATGYLDINFSNTGSSVSTKKITFKTTSDDTFELNFQVYPTNNSNIQIPTFVNFMTNDGTLNATDYYISSADDSITTNSLLVLPKPTKNGFAFAGWYCDNSFTVELPKSNGNWYLANNNYMLRAGTNYQTKLYDNRSIFLFAKYTAQYEFNEQNFTFTSSKNSDSFVYNGSPQVLSWIRVTKKSNNYVLIEGTDYTVTYSNNINAGTAKAILQGQEEYPGEYEITFQIQKASNSVSVSLQNWTYGEMANTPVATCTYGTALIYYSSSYNGQYNSEVPTNAGTYYVKAIVAGTDNYFESQDIKQFEIYKKTLDMSGISLKSKTFIYDGQPKSLAIEGNLPAEISIIYENNNKTAVGEYIVKAIFVVSSNYNDISPMMAILKIERQEITISVSIDNWTYGETPSEPVVECNVTNYEVAYSSSYAGSYNSEAPANAGTYYVKAFVRTTQYYIGKESIQQFEIYKRTFDTSTITFSSQAFTYDGQPKSLYITGTLPDEITVEYENNNKSEAGEYVVTARFTVSNNYNEISPMQATLKIVKNGVSIEVSIENWTYGETPKQPVVVCNIAGVQILYSENHDSGYKSKVPTDAGIYYIKAYLAETENYAAAEDIKQFEIYKKQFDASNIRFESKTYFYDGEVKSLKISGSLPSGIVVIYENNNKTEAGVYTVTATFVSRNYQDIAPMQATLTIKQTQIIEENIDGSFQIKLSNSRGISDDISIILTENAIDEEYFEQFLELNESVKFYYNFRFKDGSQNLQLTSSYKISFAIDIDDSKDYYLATISDDKLKKINYTEESGYLYLDDNNIDNIVVIEAEKESKSLTNTILIVAVVGFVIAIPVITIIEIKKNKKKKLSRAYWD